LEVLDVFFRRLQVSPQFCGFALSLVRTAKILDPDSQNPGSGSRSHESGWQSTVISSVEAITLCPHLRKEFFLLGSSFTTFVSPPQFSELKTNFLKGQ
jgi:hypothetical protein